MTVTHYQYIASVVPIWKWNERVLKTPDNFSRFFKFVNIPRDFSNSLKFLGILWDSHKVLKIPSHPDQPTVLAILQRFELYANHMIGESPKLKLSLFMSSESVLCSLSQLNLCSLTRVQCLRLQIQCDKVQERLSKLLYAVTPCLTRRTSVTKDAGQAKQEFHSKNWPLSATVRNSR